MSYKNIPIGTVEAFNVVIEISQGSQNKYEYDEELDAIKLDWVFSGGFAFPFNYGYIPQTKGGDGDPLDVFVISPHPIAMGTVVACRAIGLIKTLDRGEEDDKVIAVPLADPASKSVVELSDLNFKFEDFFDELGRQKGKLIEVLGYLDAKEARVMLEATLQQGI